MKKKLILIAVFSVFIICFCYYTRSKLNYLNEDTSRVIHLPLMKEYNKYQYREKSFIEVANFKEADITKIVIIGGAHMAKITYEDKKDIDKFLKLIEEDVVIIEKQPKGNNGWDDEIQFYSNGKLIKSIDSSINEFYINGNWYEIAKGDFNEKSINNLLANEISKK